MDALSCLGAPPTFFSDYSFAVRDDEAIARALQISISSDTAAAAAAASSSSSSSPSSSSSSLLNQLIGTPAAVAAAHPVLIPESPPTGGCNGNVLATRAGRVGKRKSRASKRTPTTYISTDAANFRLMVQQVTGIQAEPADVGIIVPTFDTSGLLMDVPSGPAVADAPGGAFAPPETAGFGLMDAAQPCFPTLDSWSVMYEKKEIF